jgi:AcrR family transcriptional regulator
MSAPPLVGNTRDGILDAMERLLARYGYKKTTMDDLAREAGIGKGTIYLHFPSKEEAALCSIDRVVDRVQERVRALAASPLSADERLRAMLAARVLMRFDSVQAYSQALDDLFESLRPAYMARRNRYFKVETEIFARVLREGRRKRLFSVSDVNATADALLLATNALLPYSLSPAELGKRTEIEKKVGRLANLLLQGLIRRDTVPAAK